MRRISPGRRLAIAAALVATQAIASPAELRLALVSMSQISAPDYVPNLVLYADGTLVGWDRTKRRFETCRLTESEASRLVNLPELRRLKPAYERSAVIEDLSWRLTFVDRGSVKQVVANESAPDAERFESIRKRLLHYRCREGEIWYPAQTELIFFPVGDDVPSPIVEYPRDWPTPTPVAARYPEMKRRPLHAYLDGRRFDELSREVEAINVPLQKLLRINGDRFVVRIRAPMNSEELWYGVPPEPAQPRE